MGSSKLGDEMTKITIYKYNTDNLRDILSDCRYSYRLINSLDDIEETEWLLVDEEDYEEAKEALEQLDLKVVVLCHRITKRKLDLLYSQGITDYMMKPVIEHEFHKRLRLDEEEDFDLDVDSKLGLALSVAAIGVWEYEVPTDELIWDDKMFDIHKISIGSKLYSYNHWKDLVLDEDMLLIDAAIAQLIDDEKHLDITYRLKNHETYIRMTAYVIKEKSMPVRIVGTCHDVTDHVEVKAEKDALEIVVERNSNQLEETKSFLQLARDRLDTTLKVSDIGYWEWYVDKNQSFENEQWFSMLGYDKSSFPLNDQWFYGLMHDDDLKVMVKKLEKVAEGQEENINNEFRLKKADGSWAWILARGKILDFQDDGRAKTVAGVHINITNLKQAERQREVLAEAVTNTPIGIILTDKDAVIEYVNPAFTVMTGYGDDIIGKKPSVLNSGYHNELFYDELWDTISQGERWKGVFYNKRKDGSHYWESAVISPMFDNNGFISSYVAIKEDITKEKELENQIIDRNKRLTRQQWILQSLTQNTELTTVDSKASHRLISESVVAGLEVSSCSICYFEEMNTRLRCYDYYHPFSENTFEDGLITLDNQREYFNVLLSGSQITINTLADTRYKSLYNILEEAGIKSSLHIPIWFRGEVIGIVRAEEIIERVWLPDEISFLRAISDLLTITMETRERLKAQRVAEEASKTKSDFLANMSHEIRTPMNAVIGLTHLALQTNMTPKQEDYLQKINNAAEHLLILINDILDYSKVEAGKMTLELVPFDLKVVISHLENMIYEKVKEKHLALIIDIHDNVPKHLSGDPYRLGQILINLVSNAVKFTDNGSVTVEIDRVYGDDNNDEYIMLQFVVKDTGIGMSEETMSNLFDSFEQGDTSITRRFGGTGLGLSICKQLVDLFDGEIYVESELGKGSNFVFTANFGISDVRKTNMVQKRTYQEIQKNQHTILIAEDNDINQQIISELLDSKDFKSVVVGHGRELLDYLETGEPCAMILMDLQMPVMDGFEASRLIRENSMYHHIPIIAISADPRPEIKVKSLNMGMNDFIVKPIDQDKMFDTIVKWMSTRPCGVQIKNVDTDLGIRRCNNNKSLYFNILERLVKDHNRDILNVKEAIEKRTGEEVKILHTLKGLMGHIGSTYMQQAFEDIEDFVNNRKRGYKKKLDTLSLELDEMFQDIFMALINYKQNQDNKEVDHDEVIRLLKQIETPLMNGNINEIKVITGQLDRFVIHPSIDETYEILSKQIKRYQYDDAIDSLQKIYNSWGG